MLAPLCAVGMGNASMKNSAIARHQVSRATTAFSQCPAEQTVAPMEAAVRMASASVSPGGLGRIAQADFPMLALELICNAMVMVHATRMVNVSVLVIILEKIAQ